MDQRFTTRTTAFLFCFWAYVTPAFWPATLNIDAMFGESQAVVLGRVTGMGVTGHERLPGAYGAEVTIETVELRVQRCYKPRTGCGTTVAFERRRMMINSAPTPLEIGAEAMAFLQESGTALAAPNDWSVWRVDWPEAPSEPPGPSGKELLEADLASGLNSAESVARLESMRYLQGFRQLIPEVAAKLRDIVDSQSTPLNERLRALATLMIASTVAFRRRAHDVRRSV